MYSDILIATDGSERTAGAVAHGLGLAERYGATVHALYVVDSRALSIDEEGFGDDGAVVDALGDRGERVTDEVVRRAEARGLDGTAAVVQGTPARGIRSYAADHGVDLIAMGIRGRSGLSRFVLGSVAETVLRTAERPVLTAGATAAPADTSYDDVLLPTDGSAHAERVAEHAFDIADRYGATVHALSVIDSGLIRSPGLLAALEDESEAAIEATRRAGADAGVDVVASVWRGTPHDCITTYAGERVVDLVVMGAHEARGLDRFLAQTAAERVVRRAPCPVVTVRHDG